MTEVTYKPLSMSEETLTKTVKESSRRLYNRWTVWRKFMKTWHSTRNLATAIWAYSSNMNYRSVAFGRRKSARKTGED